MKKLRVIIPAIVALIALVAGTAFIASADNHGDTFYGCLYAGSLSQVNTTTEPANCGRGMQVSWNADQAVTPADVQQHIYEKVSSINVSADIVAFGHLASCNTGDKVTGGGYRLAGVDGENVARAFDKIYIDGPEYTLSDTERWAIFGSNLVDSFGNAASGQLTVYAICVGTTPPS